MTASAADLAFLSVTSVRRLLDAREISAVELTEAHLARIEALDSELGCYLHLMGDTARVQAAAADARIGTDEASPLTGIPIALKDVLCTNDAPTTAGSRILAGYRSPYDATVVSRLRDAGAVFLGKANTDEFAMGSSNENSAYGPSATRGTSTASPAAAAVVRPPLSPPTWRPCRSAPTLVARSDNPPGSAASSASSRPTAAFRATA
jgi:aspartyl-tRNA(Asn)/glutamyl-tRNA(Gln) amidotransferase subunit A